MKNQYVGDIGDYTKLGMLRKIIQHTEMSIGVNWYLTPDDEIAKDGRHTTYLEKDCDSDDNELLSNLKSIAGRNGDNKLRTVKQLQGLGLLLGAEYFIDPLDYSGCKSACDRLELRDNWHRSALQSLTHKEVVFLDPDNGLTFTNAYGKDGNKSSTYEEACDYYKKGLSVIIYNHRDRSPMHEYIYRLNRFEKLEATADACIMCLTAPKYTQRDYLFIVQPNHRELIKQAINKILASDWHKNGYLYQRDLVKGFLIGKT